MTGAAVGPDVMAHAKELGKAVFEPRAERQAMLGVDGLKKGGDYAAIAGPPS